MKESRNNAPVFVLKGERKNLHLPNNESKAKILKRFSELQENANRQLSKIKKNNAWTKSKFNKKDSH